MSRIEITLLVQNESAGMKPPIGRPAMRKYIRETLKAGGMPPGKYEVSLRLTGDDDMRGLNTEYRGLKRTTDVLSFPQFASRAEIAPDPNGFIVLGDIVISLETLARRCLADRTAPKLEIARLLTHGVLHLVGFDHDTRAGRRDMRKLEDGVVDTVSGGGV